MKILQYKKIIESSPIEFSDENEIWALDLELAELKEEQIHRPYGRLVSLAGTSDGEVVYIIYDENQVQEFLNKISKATWVFHNSVFDLGHLRRWANIPERKNMRDTMLIEKLLWSNYYDSFGLNDLARRYLGIYLEKDTRKEFKNLEGAMTRSQIDYAAKDVVATWLVDKEQQKIISKHDMTVWNSIYNPHVWSVLELGGFSLDRNAWMELVVQQQAIVDKIEEELGQKYGHEETTNYKRKPNITKFVPFNPASPEQVKELFRIHGLDVESTGEKEIKRYVESFPIVQKILDYREAAKKVSTYGMSFLKFLEPDGKIYTSLNISLAETGRDSSSSPNLQNILTDKEYRKCFIAGHGRKLVIYDYSGQEANLFAYNTQDLLLIEIINSGKKLYIEVARIAFGETVQKDSPRYKKIKSLVLGLMYGLTPFGYAKQEDIELEDAQKMFDAFFAAFPVTAKWVKDRQSHNPGFATTILGRKIHLHPYSRQWKTNILNDPQQGSAGDMIKLAMKAFRHSDAYKREYPTGGVYMVLQVHDEIIVNSREEIALEVAETLSKCMNSVAEQMHPGIISRVSGGVCDNWSEKG